MNLCPTPRECRATECFACSIGHPAGCRCNSCDEDRRMDADRDQRLEDQ